MLKRIWNWLFNLSSLDSRLSSFEERLSSLERAFARQQKVGKYAILFGTGVALMGFGAGSGAVHTPIHPAFAAVTFLVGFLVMLLALLLRWRA